MPLKSRNQAGAPAPRSLVMANQIAILVAIVTAVFLIWNLNREAQERNRREEWRELLIKTVQQNNSGLALRKLLSGKGALGHDADQALFESASNGNNEAVAVLLDHGALADIQEKYRYRTPLLAALESGHLDTARVLLRKGAKVDFPDQSGRTPLHHAASDGEMKAIRFLLKHGANPDACDEDGNTPLQAATDASQKLVVRFLKTLPK